jgi:thymidylate kinase
MFTITIFVPITDADAVRAALAEAGGGRLGDYDSCSFSSTGTGRFRPLDGANPHIGAVGRAETVDEQRIETVVLEKDLPAVVAAVKRAHPYEEPAIFIAPMLDYKSFLPSATSSTSASTSTSSNGSGTSTGSGNSSSDNVTALPITSRRAVSIVLEALDGVGKTTVAETLRRRLAGPGGTACVAMRTPPDSMRGFREYFTAEGGNIALRKAYYMVGNFVAGTEMAASVRDRGVSVVLDRYYASTLSYLYGKDTANPLPDKGTKAYEWPAQLPKADFMVLLSLSQEERIKRRASRVGEAETAEEALLRQRPEVAERINEAYRRFGCIEVPLKADDGPEVVVDKILAACGLA